MTNISEYKVKNYENIYIFDDLYSRVLFEFKSKKLTTYEITTGLFYNPIID